MYLSRNRSDGRPTARVAGNAGGSVLDGQIRAPGTRQPIVVRRESGRMSNANPYAPPQAKVVDIPVDNDDLELAGVGVRLGAYLIDTIIVWLAILIPLSFALGLSFGQSRGPGTGIAWLMFFVCIIAVTWINIVYLLRNGQTIAKKWLGIKIVRADGSPASFSRIFWLRGFVNSLITSAFGLYFFVDSLLIFGDARQCVHDKIADTIVVVA
jgi:uncharacterized RDD family membrane protein YckC